MVRFYLYWIILRLSRNNPVFRIIIDHLAYWYYSVFRRNKQFTFNGKKYSYFYHLYNRTVAGERVVEIPIAKMFLDQHKGKSVLEVGNVMSHYFPITHDVLDKYEKAPGVMNEDVADFNPRSKYDLILSVSTMEHVGYSFGEKKEPEKFSRGIRSLKSLMKDGGKLVVTLPLFYNNYVTNLIFRGRSPFTEEYFFRRTSFLNEWGEIDLKTAMTGAAYDKHYANANILYVGIFKKKKYYDDKTHK